MKISTKGRYGLRALIDLHMHYMGGYVSLSEISQRQDVSVKYLEGIFSGLKKAGFVAGVAGMNGGYKPLKNPRDITLRSVLEALESDFCIAGGVQEDASGPIRAFLTRMVWDKADECLMEIFSSKTVYDLIQEFKNRALAHESSAL